MIVQTMQVYLTVHVIHLICRISAQGSRIVCHLLYTHHCNHSLLLGWSFPSLELLLPLSPCFCSSESQLKSGYCLFSYSMYALLDSVPSTRCTMNISIIQETSRARCHQVSHPALHSTILHADCLCVWY